MSSNLESSAGSAENSTLELNRASKSENNLDFSPSSDTSSIATAESTSLTAATSVNDVKALYTSSESTVTEKDMPGVTIDESAKPTKMPHMSSIYTALSTGVGLEQGEAKLSALTTPENEIPKLNIVQSEKNSGATESLSITNPFPELKLVKDGKNGLVVDTKEVDATEAKGERIPAFDSEPKEIANSNRKIIETSHQALNKKPWQSNKYAQYLEGGKIASAASVSEVLKAAGFKFQESANPANLVKRLIAEGWTMHGIKQAKAGDLVFGGKKDTNWRKGANNANVGIVSARGNYIYHNDSATGNWTASKLDQVFSQGEYGGQVWVLRPPAEIPTKSNYRPREIQNNNGDRPANRGYDQSISSRRIVIDQERPGYKNDGHRPSDNRPANPESNYWSDYWKGYWNNYWREYWRDHYSNRRNDSSNYRPSNNNRQDLVPNGWDYNQHNNRRPDSNNPQRNIDDRYLPPEWRNDAWRRPDSGGRHRPNDNSNNYQNGRDARVVRHRPGNLNMLGPPTITPQKINEVLRQYNSPAQGMGQLVFDLGVQSGINPAIALAFFIKESSAGTKGIARTTKNWGNRKGSGPAGRYKGFMRYNNFEESLRDWFPYMHRVYINQGRQTLPRVISKYAPGYDGNNERGYVRTVDRLLTKWSV